jgi:hypothetical protein
MKITKSNELNDPKFKSQIIFKNKWIAKDFLQRENIDFDQIWISIVSSMGARVLIIWVTANRWFIRQSDIKTAFLNNKIEKEIYIEQLTNFEIKTQNGSYLVCLLNKAFYKFK